MKKDVFLTTTQLQFVDYIRKNLDESNRIIFFKHNGHFGLGYAISSMLGNVKIYDLSELKQKSGKDFVFRILNIIFAIISFCLKMKKDVDSEDTVSAILNNMENIYLGIDKEKEYLKHLQIKKWSHRYKKISYIIRIEDQEINSSEDIQAIKLLCNLIKEKKINNTLLLISGDNLIQLFQEFNFYGTKIPFFQLTDNDIIHIINSKGFQVLENIEKNVELVQKLGLSFFVDHYSYFNALTKVEIDLVDWLKQIEWIINIILKEYVKEESLRNQLFPLLEFTSFFKNKFTKTEIMRFQNNLLDAQNLNLASRLAIIEQLNSSIYNVPTYRYGIDAFKYFFVNKYKEDLIPLPQYIFSFFRENYPFEYSSAVKILQVDSSFIDYGQKQSLLLIGYYYESVTKGNLNYDEFMRYTTKSSNVQDIITVYEAFRHSENIAEDNIIHILNELRKNSLDDIASCAGYTMILQILKENYIHFKNISFSKVLKELVSHIVGIDTENNYNLYWKMYFMCQYIALYLEDEETNESTARKFLRDIKKLQETENFIAYIDEKKLRGFSRIDLLSFSLGYDNAGELLKKLYITSEESTILKELARINYSAYLIENELYREAEKILKKGNKVFLKNINVDTYGGYLNNLYLAQYQNKTIYLEEYIAFMQKLILENISYNDKLIMENNLCVAYLIMPELEHKGESRLREILKEGNPYNKFYAQHNLLSYYYLKGDTNKFNNIYENIKIPKLLLSNTTFFWDKFKKLKINIENSIDHKIKMSDKNDSSSYGNLYLWGTIERWFE